MNPLLKRIHHIIVSSSLLSDESSLIIGVSGGADSIALLHILSILFPATRRIVVYVDHGLRPNETDAEKKMVQEQAGICCADFETVAVDVQGEKDKNKCSLEEAARTLRYRAFEDIRIKHKATTIAVGHTANDQAEEVLLRLIRGSGSAGLSGMNQLRGHIIRPLLHETKKTLLHYLQEQHIPFCQDSSNFDTRFLRNKIRLELLPILERDYNASMQQTLLQTAAVLSDEDSLLTQLTEAILPEVLQKEPGKITLSLPLFTEQPVAIQRRVLDNICWTLHSKPSFKKIQSLLKLAATNEQKEIHLTDGLRAVKHKDTILFHRPSSKKGYRGPGVVHKTFSPVSIPSPGIYPVPGLAHTLSITKLAFSPDLLKSPGTVFVVDANAIKFPLYLRQIRAGESFHPLGAPGRKKIARFLSDQKIPTMERNNYPLLLSGEKNVALAGIRIDHEFRITQTTSQVLLLQWQKS
ncbi:tRNA lysidine(34) synthetase TilS [Desulfocapsa sp. AH-315-G09]|nr:tRNA lysidine(34) synthetase TilS [Desulfocapsa sp.]MBN4065521.1 tRNA lysidine(34) synthetase TilS [Desulfocapsa sp. AH-315-G09]